MSDLITIPSFSISRVEDVTRRTFMTGALASAFLIACGDEDERESPEAATRAIETPKGIVEIPAHPQRIVALDASGTVQILDELGASMVAAGALGGGVRVLVSDAAKALPVIGITIEFDLEAIAAVRPDLIIGRQQFAEEIYEQLSVIAPTVLVPGNQLWHDIYRSVADAAGFADQADRSVAELEKRAADLQASIAKAWPNGVTVSVLRITQTPLTSVRSYSSFQPSRINAVMLRDLDGVTVTADRIPGASEKFSFDIDAERLRDVDADIILYYLGGGSTADADRAALEAGLVGHPLWPSLDAVRAGRAHRIDSGPWDDGLDFGAANLVLDDLFKYLA